MSISDFAEEPKQETVWGPTETQETQGLATPANESGQEQTPTSSDAPVAETSTISTNSVVVAPAETTTPTPTSPVVKQSPEVNEIVSGILGRIAPIGTHSNLKLMVIGDPGSGKSSIAATAPNNLIVDAEDGALAAKNSPHGIADGVLAYPWKGFDDFRNLVGLFLNKHPDLDNFKVFTLDTLSEVHKRGLQEIMANLKRLRPSTNEFVPDTDQYTEINERVVRIVRALRDMERDLIIISHARTVEPKNKPSKTYADFSESLSNKIMAMMDVVGYMSWRRIDDQMVPVMRVISDGHIHAKNRLGMPEEIINPTYANIKAAWEETKSK